jgi:hypothetical protein
MAMVIETGDLKPFTTAQCTQLLHNYWSQYTPESMQSMIQYADEIASLLTFGPLRDREDQKLEAALGLKIASPAEREQADG